MSVNPKQCKLTIKLGYRKKYHSCPYDYWLISNELKFEEQFTINFDENHCKWADKKWIKAACIHTAASDKCCKKGAMKWNDQKQQFGNITMILKWCEGTPEMCGNSLSCHNRTPVL